MKTALVLGATGLVGSQLVKLLLDTDSFDRVRVLTRRTTGVQHQKLEEIVIDFDQPEKWAEKVIGDVLFCAFGTTLKKAGNKEAQYKIDYHYQFLVNRLAAENGVLDCVIVSSPGASPNSRFFYNRMKGDLDRDVSKLSFDKLRIIQPSVLAGKREENRGGERLAIVIGNLLSWIPGIRKYRPISGESVAKAMIQAYNDENPMHIVVYGLEKLHQMSKLYK